MKKNVIFLVSFFVVMLVSCSDTMEFTIPEPSSDVETRSPSITGIEICWNEENQEIEGFGVSQAAWSTALFTHSRRDEVSALLFGPDGLNINMLRGQIYPYYWENETDTTFKTDLYVDMPLGDPYFETAEKNDLDLRAQLWISKVAKMNYGLDKLFFTTWTPPLFMKTVNDIQGGKLAPDYYQRYAEYLTKFCEEFAQAGLDIYAISPANEANFAAVWGSCIWTEQEMGKFIYEYLGPTLEQSYVNPLVVFGELAQWSAPLLGAFDLVSNKKYIENVIKAYPDIARYADVAAGHGYNIPKLPYEFPIVPYDLAVSKGLQVWQTEISSTFDTFDPSMSNALNWAEVFHKYLAVANVNAFMWWAGAQPTWDNECLIQLLDDDYCITKRYETYGNYTRYIKPGSVRITAKTGLLVSNNILVSSYKKGNEYVTVVINKTSGDKELEMKLNGATPAGSLKGYLTNENNKWSEIDEVEQVAGNKYYLNLPARSVVTFIGLVN